MYIFISMGRNIATYTVGIINCVIIIIIIILVSSFLMSVIKQAGGYTNLGC